MTRLEKNFAIRALLLLLCFSATTAYAASLAGSVTHLSGPLFAKKTDGILKVLAEKSTVEQGDTLISEKNTYASIKFIDNSEITLRPNSQMLIDSFSYSDAQPENDHAIFSLIKGGMRAVTGLLGKRSNDRFSLKTPTATIGIRGTTFIAEYVSADETSLASLSSYSFTSLAAVDPSLLNAGSPNATISDAPIERILMRDAMPMQLAQNTPPVPGAKAPGLYVQVLDGIINLSNKGGSQSFSAGQFGYTASFVKPPVVLPANPGIQFTPPPAFSTSSSSSSAGNSSKSGTVDCEVR